jgi:hypothetical protein
MDDSMALGGIMAIIMGSIIIVSIISLIISIVILVSRWKINTKAGQPGWAIFVPIYSLYIQTKVLQRPNYWIWLYIGAIITSFIFIGLIAIIVLLIMDTIRLAKVFGKSDGFVAGLILLPIIFIPMLAFGDSKYVQIEE